MIKNKCVPFFFVGIIVITFFLLLVFYIVGSNEVYSRLDIGYGSTISEDIVYLEIGDRMFSIPKSYIWSREDWKGGKVDGVNMHALLPGFESYSKENKHLFKNPNSRKEINIFMREHAVLDHDSTKTVMTRELIYERMIYDHGRGKLKVIKNHEASFDLTRQELEPSITGGGDLFVGYKNSGKLYWVVCPSDGKYTTPSCKTWVEYSSHVTINYSFPKQYLDKWNEIDNQVLVFIRSFEVNNSLQGR